MRLIMAVVMLAVLASSALAGPILANRTTLSFNPGEGSRVEYTDGRGDIYLWYPGDGVVHRGRYYFPGSDLPFLGKVCFNYPDLAFNPVPGATGDDHKCVPTEAWVGSSTEWVDGDAFGLARRQSPPFVLGRGSTTLRRLAAKAAVALPSRVFHTDDYMVRVGQ